MSVANYCFFSIDLRGTEIDPQGIGVEVGVKEAGHVTEDQGAKIDEAEIDLEKNVVVQRIKNSNRHPPHQINVIIMFLVGITYHVGIVNKKELKNRY